MAALVKSEGEILDWTLLDDTGSDAPSAETPDIVKATELETHVLVVVAHADTNDAAAAYVTVTLMGKLGANLEDWRAIQTYQAGGGQSVTEALDAASAAAQTQIKVAATTDWDTGLGERLLLQNVGTLVNSELVTIDGWADADYYTANENLSNSHDAGDGDALYSGVNEILIPIPAGLETFKITFHNSDGDATYLVRADYYEVDSIG